MPQYNDWLTDKSRAVSRYNSFWIGVLAYKLRAGSSGVFPGSRRVSNGNSSNLCHIGSSLASDPRCSTPHPIGILEVLSVNQRSDGNSSSIDTQGS